MIEMLMSLGIFVLWVWLVVICATIGAVADSGKGAAATGLFVMGAAAFCWLVDANPLTWILHNPLEVGLALLFYAPLGALWARFRWGAFIRKASAQIDEAFAAYKRENNLGDVETWSNDQRDAWNDRVQDIASEGNYQSLPILVREHKARILSWIAYWPFLIPWYFLHDFLQELVEAVYRRMAGYLQRVSDEAFQKTAPVTLARKPETENNPWDDRVG